MNCDKCQHMKAIKKALAPCQRCDAGRVHNQISADAASIEWCNKHRAQDMRTQDDGATALPPDVEDRLRKAMASLFQLDPIKFLLVRHIVNGGSYSTFRRDLRGLMHHVIDRDYDLSDISQNFRSIAQQWGGALGQQFTEFAAIAPKQWGQR